MKGSRPSGPAVAVPPPWKDEAAVADWVLKRRRRALLGKMGLEEGPYGDIYSILDPDPEPSAEEQAVEAAKRGKLQELSDLFERAARASKFPDHPDHPRNISPSTLQLVAEFLGGKRNLKTGRTKEEEQRGRPKMSDTERVAATPTHEAANHFVPAVIQVLREEYPNQSANDYRDRALYIVSHFSGVPVETLSNYLRRPRGGAHRI